MSDGNTHDCIAVVGMACRFPGAPDLSAYWRLLSEGRDGLTHFTDADLVAAGVDRRLLDNPAYVRAGMVLDDIEAFDAEFFHVAAFEAAMMDPQQRLLLECAWHALEDAGRPPSDRLRIATYVGGRASDYLFYHQEPPDIFGHFEPSPEVGLQRLVLNDKDYLATRLAYVMDLRGPAITVQTACSTSLVAAHMGCQALLNGECDLALAGGASLRVPHRVGYLYSEGMIFPSDGRTRPFDANANGPIVGSGVGLVALRRLSDALADGDRIYAVIRGSAVNNDGAAGKTAFTAPSLDGQVRVISEALAVSQVDARTISYIEAHGTSTRVGDPVEIAALTEAFGRGVPAGTCAIGSVKSNVGHLFHAAGVAGLIKTALMIEHRTLVPLVGFERPNPLIDFSASPFVVNTESRPWTNGSEPLRAGVSAFGFGGTNAHLILEEPPRRRPREFVNEPHVLPISARSDAALSEVAASYVRCLETMPEAPPGDICRTAQNGRRHFTQRLAVVGASVAEMRDRLAAILTEGVARGRAGEREQKPCLAFVFAGQGGQYGALGRGLHERYPVFRRSIEDSNRILLDEINRPLTELLLDRGAEAALRRTEYAQPALLAFEVAVATLWRSWGIEPSVVFGHSLGEVAAAWSAGLLSLDEALRFAAVRGRLMQRAEPGAMGVVFASADVVAALLRQDGRDVAIAALNGPEQTVVSGTRPSVTHVLAASEARGLATRLLVGESAFHSCLMDPVLGELEAYARRFGPVSPRTPFISTLTGAQPAAETRWAEHWRRQAREPVRLMAAVEAATAAGANVFLEIGPDATLTALGTASITDPSHAWLATLRKDADPGAQLLGTLAALYERGVSIDWNGVESADARLASLPGYPFQRRRFWIERSAAPRPQSCPAVQAHPLLGQRFASPLQEVQFQSELTADVASFARDHWLYGVRPLVMVGHLEMMRGAAAEVLHASPPSTIVVEDLVIEQPLLLSGEIRRVQTVLTPHEDGASDIRIFSTAPSEPAWCRHSTARVRAVVSDSPEPLDLGAIRARCASVVSGDQIRAEKRRRGAQIGPALETPSRVWRGAGEALVEAAVHPDDGAELDKYFAYPGLLDACAQCADLTLARRDSESADLLFLPVLLDRAAFYHRLPDRVWVHLRGREQTDDTGVFGVDASIADQNGRVLVEIDGLSFKLATPESLRRKRVSEESDAYDIDWVPINDVVPAPAHMPVGTWLIVPDEGGFGARLASELERQGAACVVLPGNDQDLDPQALRSQLSRLRGASCLGIVHLRSLDFTDPCDPLDASRRTCGNALSLVQAMLEEQVDSALWLVTRGGQATGREIGWLAPGQSPLWGLGRVIQREQPSIGCRLVDLDPAGVDGVAALVRVLTGRGTETEMAVRGSTVYASRLRRQDPKPGAPSSNACILRNGAERTIGGLIVEAAERRVPGPGEIEIAVHASGLNFRDVLNATGRINGPLGYECSGIVTQCGEGVTHLKAGDSVIAIAPHAFASHIVTDARLTVLKPAHLGHAAAAGQVVAYLTAYHALVEQGGLGPGKRVLIHTAAGGVGQAAIHVARAAGAEVFATASRPKWPYLRGLGIAHVSDSRAPGFAPAVRDASGGRGVDVVLNTLGREFLNDNLDVLNPGGCLIDLGDSAVQDLHHTADSAAARRIGFVNFHVAQDVTSADPDRAQALLQMLTNSLTSGVYPALPVRAFRWADLRQAFETMLRGAHVAKLVVTHPAAELDESISCAPDATYLITGGLGTVGWRLAEWLLSRGARHLALVSRHPPSASVAAAIAARVRDGAVIRCMSADVADRQDLRRALDEVASQLPRVRGVIHAAGVTDDGVIPTQDWARFEKVLSAKAAGAWHLHELTAPMNVDFFVLISSAAGLLGNPGQANYAAANVYLDQLAHYRRQLGLCALTINYGLWAGAGMGLALSNAARNRRATNGMHDIDPDSAVRALERALAADRPQTSVISADWHHFRASLVGTVPSLVQQLGLSAKVDPPEPPQVPSGASLAPRTLDDALQRVRPHVAALINAPPGFDPEHTLSDLGLDSLAVLLLRGRLVAEFGSAGAVPIVRFLERRTVSELVAMIWDRARPVAAALVLGNRPLTPLRSGGSRAPVFLVPPLGRTAMVFGDLAKALEPGHPVLSFNPVGIGEAVAPHSTVEAMAEHWIEEIRSVFPAGPYVLGGMCFGAIVAWEMAVQLQTARQTVALFVSIDGTAPRMAEPVTDRLMAYVHDARAFARRGELGHAILRSAKQRLFRSAWMEENLPTGAPEMRSVSEAQFVASVRYRARPFSGRALVFLSEQYSIAWDQEERWRRLSAGNEEIIVFPGTTHASLLNPVSVPVIAEALSTRLRTLS